MRVFILTNSEYIGDNNQLKGIQLALQSLSQELDFIQIDESDLNIDTLTAEDFVFVSGKHGLNIAQNIKQYNEHFKVLWSGHQYFHEFNLLPHLPNIVALPKTALTDTQKTYLSHTTQLILTSGVAHCINKKVVTEEHSRFNRWLPDLNKFPIQIGIVLAGDAPDENDNIKFFTKDDAIIQAISMATYLHAINYSDTAIILKKAVEI